MWRKSSLRPAAPAMPAPTPAARRRSPVTPARAAPTSRCARSASAPSTLRCSLRSGRSTWRAGLASPRSAPPRRCGVWRCAKGSILFWRADPASRELSQRGDVAEMLARRLRRDAEPALTRRHVVHHAGGGADLRAGADVEVAGEADLAAEHGEIADHAGAGDADLGDDHAMATE